MLSMGRLCGTSEDRQRWVSCNPGCLCNEVCMGLSGLWWGVGGGGLGFMVINDSSHGPLWREDLCICPTLEIPAQRSLIGRLEGCGVLFLDYPPFPLGSNWLFIMSLPTKLHLWEPHIQMNCEGRVPRLLLCSTSIQTCALLMFSH
jgi:hypothetical protein